MTTELAGIRQGLRDAGGNRASLHVSGIGKERASATMNRIVADAPDAVIMAGFCGAADPSLLTGDLHVAGLFQRAEGTGCRSSPIPSHPGLALGLTAAAGASGCRVVTAPSATVASVAGIDAKSAVHSALGAASVNMEDYWAASSARSAGVPFASVRAVLDLADQELPPWIAQYSASALRIVWGLSTRPGRLSELLQLARQDRLARRNLTRCVLTAIASLAQTRPLRKAVSC